MRRTAFAAVCMAVALAGGVQAQLTGTTTLQVTVPAEASLSISTVTTGLSNGGNATFGNDYTGTTNFTYKIRTTQSGGTGAITSTVTTDFGAGGPSVANPPSAGDTLSYSCTVSSPGTGCSSQTASTTASKPVATFGAGAKSAIGGNTGSVAWDLTDDPQYGTGTYSATVTFTISAA